MTVFVHRIETAVPEGFYTQTFASELMQKNVGSRDGTKRVIRSIYDRSGIEKRHSVINDFDTSCTNPLFFDQNGNHIQNPDTYTRNNHYTREARRLFSRLGDQLISNTQGFEKQDITHVITVSCTGFFAPGPDYYVVRDLDLNSSVERFHIGFMGCYAAFQGLKMANAICSSEPDSVVLVLCVELCTLHLQFDEHTDAIISASVFGDGGSGALVSARKPQPVSEYHKSKPEKPIRHHAESQTEQHQNNGTKYVDGDTDHKHTNVKPLKIRTFLNDLAIEGEQDMAWTIGNHGFEMKLSTYVPDIIHKNIRPLLENMLLSAGNKTDEIAYWAIHPGGRAILDKIQQALELNEQQLYASRSVLRDYGNMSSATILFVLKIFMEDPRFKPDNDIFAMAFGPGLTIETGLFQLQHPFDEKVTFTNESHVSTI